MMSSLGCGKWACTQCGYKSGATKVRNHVEAKHLVVTDVYTCTICHVELKNRIAFNNHMYRNHK